MHRIAAVFVIMVLLFALAIPVLAIEGFDFSGVFKGLFGDKTEIVEENGALPTVNVLKNTFKDIDINITGIVGDDTLIYIMIDVTRKDGNAFEKKWNDQCGFCDDTLTLNSLDETRVRNKRLEEDGQMNQFIEFSQRLYTWWVPLEDDHPRDNTMTLAYIVNIETQVDGKPYFVPGEIYTLTLEDFRNEPPSSSCAGVWKAEFVADYSPPETITKEVHAYAKLPDWGTSDQFTSGFTLGSFELSPFALRYHCDDYAEKDRAWKKGAWDCQYVEMKDGSTIGYKEFDEYNEKILNGQPRFLEENRDIVRNGKILQENISLMIFPKPIDLDEVKAVHFGDLTVPIDYTND